MAAAFVFLSKDAKSSSNSCCCGFLLLDNDAAVARVLLVRMYDSKDLSSPIPLDLDELRREVTDADADADAPDEVITDLVSA